MCDSKKIRDAVFKKKLLRRLYGDLEETETTKQDQDNLEPETDTDRTSLAAKYTCQVRPKKKVYSVIPRPPGILPEKGSPLEEGPEFVREEEDEESGSELEEEVKKRRRRKRKQRSADQPEGQNQKTERITGGAANIILTKNQKRKLKKKKRKEREKVKDAGESNKEFTFSVNTSVDIEVQHNKSRREELHERLPKLVEFIRAVWEVYDQDAVKDTETRFCEENLDTLLNQVTSISDTEEDAMLDEFNNLWHLKTLLVLADNSRAKEKIKHLENITTLAIDNESKDLLCTLMRYWMTDIANQR
ncbi:uncharacterized protein LOC110443591 isoform X2 [Mizuhopecten yessoensis]|uniref:uncharacterized protein LOC110443591 isoform X2 n=1 Tax=Mizuhopecten yessoensis TaxID=6573 RepID=UPI000B4577A6|nr:uncharacterized protein LOC110443591 isoform X2 [Mizuhopecten yessoensis]